MELREAKDKFIQTWGTLGTSWGINRAMAQIQALLFVSNKALSTEEIMAELAISRGNANMNLRALLDWGIVEKERIPGDRKEYFRTEKDVWELARVVSRERRRREIEPAIKVLKQLEELNLKSNDVEQEFTKQISELHNFSVKLDGVLEKFGRSDKNWFYRLLMKI